MVPHFLGVPCFCLPVLPWIASRYKGEEHRAGAPQTEAPVSPNKGVRHHSCKITHRMKFIRVVYLYSWLDVPMVSMGMGRAAQ